MQRQKAYLTAYVEKMQSMDENDLEKAWDSLDVMDDYIQTSVTRNQYLGLVKTLKKAEFTEDSIEQLPGTDQEGDLHDEFHVDEDALRELIIYAPNGMWTYFVSVYFMKKYDRLLFFNRLVIK